MISLQIENYITANRICCNNINFLLTFSAIHRNSAASGLFIQAINSRFENLNKVKLSSRMQYNQSFEQKKKSKKIGKTFCAVSCVLSFSMNYKSIKSHVQVCSVKKTLHSLEAIHMSQSGTLLTLLVDKFLHTNHLAVARLCDMIACRRVEMLLAENVQVKPHLVESLWNSFVTFRQQTSHQINKEF